MILPVVLLHLFRCISELCFFLRNFRFLKLKTKFLMPCFRSGNNLSMYLRICWYNNSSVSTCITVLMTWRLSRIKILNVQKQPPRGVPSKRYSEVMQQIYGRTPMPKCDFNKIALQFYWNCTSAWVFYCKFAVYFQNTFS